MLPTIIIADDHPISANGLKIILRKMLFNTIGIYSNGLQALNHISLEKPDYVLLDIQMPGLNGLDVVEKMKSQKIKSKIIIYTMFTDAALFQRAIQLGVDGYLLKEFALDDLEECIKVIKKGAFWYHPKLEERLKKSTSSFSQELYSKLTLKEKAILLSISNYKESKQIAKEQFLSEKSIESYRKKIVEKLELPNKRNALLIWAIENKGFFSLMD